MYLSTIEKETITKISVLRAMLRIIQTPGFNEFYTQYSDQSILDQWIIDGNKEALVKVFKEYLYGPLFSESLRELRLKARNKGVENWFWLTKPTLIRILSQC